MNEKPILFSGEMIRAILSGKKTQTRRLVKPQPEKLSLVKYYAGNWDKNCPYGKPGDRLWVRETWAHARMPSEDILVFRSTCPDDKFNYACPQEGTIAQYKIDKWRPSIHMPRWASRINLEITNVRVERLQEISEEDAVAEGMIRNQYGYSWRDNAVKEQVLNTARLAFANLWLHMNEGANWNLKNPEGESWQRNPWVWVIEFRRLK